MTTAVSYLGEHGERNAHIECGRYLVKRGRNRGECCYCVMQHLIDNSGPNGYVEQMEWMRRDREGAS